MTSAHHEPAPAASAPLKDKLAYCQAHHLKWVDASPSRPYRDTEVAEAVSRVLRDRGYQGITSRYVAKLRDGEVSNAGVEILRALEEFYDVPSGYLMGVPSVGPPSEQGPIPVAARGLTRRFPHPDTQEKIADLLNRIGEIHAAALDDEPPPPGGS